MKQIHVKSPESIDKFIKDSLSANVQLISAKVFSRTTKDYGFNVTAGRFETLYLHTGRGHIGLAEGDEIICSSSPSERVARRIDIDQFCLLTDMEKALGQYIKTEPLETIFLNLKTEWFKKLVFKSYFLTIIQRLVEDDSDESICKHCDRDLIRSFITQNNRIEILDIALASNTKKADEIIHLVLNDTQEILKDSERLWAFCLDHPQFIDRVVAMLRSDFKDDFLQTFPNHLFAIHHSKIPFSDERYLGYFLHHFEDESQEAKRLIIQEDPEPYSQITSELINCAVNFDIDTDTFSQHIAKTFTATTLVQVVKLICSKDICDGFMPETIKILLDRINANDIKISEIDCVKFIQAFAEATPNVKREFIQSCPIDVFCYLLKKLYVISFTKQGDFDYSVIWKRIETLDDAGTFLSKLPLIASKIIFDNVPDEGFIFAFHHKVPEERKSCNFIVNGQYLKEPSEKRSKFKDILYKNNQLQAVFLAKILDYHEANQNVGATNADNTPMFIKTFDSDLVQKIFDAHANPLREIENIIFKPCVTVPTLKKKKLLACEGRIITLQNRETCILCRTDRCKSASFYSDNGILLDCLDKFFKINSIKLSEVEKFTRSISAINRWNEILDRLVCRDCHDPLHYSEHNRESMGRLAYGASYWHCGNRSCNGYGKSVKLTHCRNCGKIIDSREDEIPCNPKELLAYKKYYLCQSCGSCCHKHNWIGTCPKCGQNNAFDNYQGEHKGLSKCKNSNCNHTIKLPKRYQDIYSKIIDANIKKKRTTERPPKQYPGTVNAGQSQRPKGNRSSLHEDFLINCT